MARFGWICVIALAACGGDKGAFLSITSPVALSRVELFEGKDAVTDSGSCSGGGGCTIGPPTTNASANPFGIRYTGDGYTSPAATAWFATVSGTKLDYQLEPDSDDDMLPALLIVGYDRQDLPAAALVLHQVPVTHSAEQLDVTLVAVAAIDAPSGERLQVWRRPDDVDARKQSACALIVHGDQRSPEWFVPSDDTDCDGALPGDMTAPECKAPDAPWNWCGVSSPSIHQADSIEAETNGACRLLAPQCADAGPKCPSMTVHEALTVPAGCIQHEVCPLAMQGLGCNSFDAACVGMVVSQNAAPYISCPAFTPVAAGGYTACTTRMVVMSSTGAMAPVIMGRTIDDVQLVAFTTPTQWGSSVTASGATYTPTALATPGVYDIVASGTASDGPGALLLDFITGPAPIQHRFIPLYLESGASPCVPGSPQYCSMPTAQYICP